MAICGARDSASLALVRSSAYLLQKMARADLADYPVRSRSRLNMRQPGDALLILEAEAEPEVRSDRPLERTQGRADVGIQKTWHRQDRSESGWLADNSRAERRPCRAKFDGSAHLAAIGQLPVVCPPSSSCKLPSDRLRSHRSCPVLARPNNVNDPRSRAW